MWFFFCFVFFSEVSGMPLEVNPSETFKVEKNRILVNEGIFVDTFNSSDRQNTNVPSRTTYHIEFTVENGTMIVAPKHSIFEVIPVDYLCDFCIAIIDKLKIRQNVEAEFEKNINHECWSYNQTELDDGNICELVNKVNLERLKADNTTKICVDEKLCPDKEKEEEEKRRAIDQKKQEAKRIEDAKRAENERLRKEKEEQMKNEEIENAKTEAARLEYEKRKMEEAKKKAEERKISKIHSVTGDEEYIIDEVNKEEDEKNDYLDGKLGNMELEVKSHTTERHFKGEISHEENTTISVKNMATIIHDTTKVSGNAALAQNGYMRKFVDRTVNVSLEVDDLRK